MAFPGFIHSVFGITFLLLHRGPNISAHDILNLLNELGKRDKMRGSIAFFATCLINLIVHEHECLH